MRATGGFVEICTDAAVRPRPTVELPDRGPFMFGPPYNTRGIRITNGSDMEDADLIGDVGYSYWNNLNAHHGQPTLLVMLTIRGRGACLYEVDKATHQVIPRGPLFPPGHPLANETAEGWYWSFTDPDLLYCQDKTHLYRLHVASRRLETVIDISPIPVRTDEILWQWHTSADDRVHSATVKAGASRDWTPQGTIVYREGMLPWSWYPRIKGPDGRPMGELDESQIDKSGNWLLIKENLDGRNGEDNRFIHAPSRAEVRILLDEDGAGGHSDLGWGYMVAADNYERAPNAVRVWKMDGSAPQGLVVHHGFSWDGRVDHVAHGNAQPGDYMNQIAFGSGANRLHLPRANEILAFPLDGSLRVMPLAPVMTDLEAPGGDPQGRVGKDYDYTKLPKANVCPCGRYVIWTSNMGGRRADAFIVQVPQGILTPALESDEACDGR